MPRKELSIINIQLRIKKLIDHCSLSIHHSPKGFTLVELLVAIAIVAIIAAVGFVSYSQSQKIARDAKRKQDLREIAKALQLYYGDNKRYPCSTLYQFSTANPSLWITDEDTDGTGPCGATGAGFTSSYIGALPVDPLKGTLNPIPGANTSNTGYAYFGRGDCQPPYTTAGYFFALFANLENAQDPEAIGQKDVLWCDGGGLKSVHTYKGSLFVVTSL